MSANNHSVEDGPSLDQGFKNLILSGNSDNAILQPIGSKPGEMLNVKNNPKLVNSKAKSFSKNQAKPSHAKVKKDFPTVKTHLKSQSQV